MADPILLWNEISLEANRVSHTTGQGEQTGPTLSARALAIVHLAMYDAFAGITNDATKFPQYLPNLPHASLLSNVPAVVAANITASVAGAAHRTLTELFPSQRPFFDSILAGAGSKGSDAHNYGVAIGDAILTDRKNDPGAGGMYKPSPLRGKHRPDPDNAGQGFHAPEYGSKSDTFAVRTRFALAPPPFNDGKDPDYKSALEEVRGQGIAPELAGTLPDDIVKRTPDQTLLGVYWAYDGASELGTPPRLYNQIVRKVAIERNKTVGENAVLFAFVNVAMADAGILAWEQKYRHNFWRPVVGVREHDRSMGPAGPTASNPINEEGDPFWLPLGAPNSNRIAKNFTPNFPAYPSGHATFGAAAFQITRRFYKKGGTFSGKLEGDDLFKKLDFVSDELNGITSDNRGTIRPRHRRNFAKGLFDMILENGFSRVYLGVHWVFDAFAAKRKDGKAEPDLKKKSGDLFIGGVPLGLQIADDIFDSDNRAPKRAKTPPLPAVTTEGSETFASNFQPSTPSR
jgi:vanadium chloroperoxidase